MTGAITLGREVAVSQLLQALTWRRLWNVVKIGSSFLLSAIFKRNIVWGVPAILNIEPTNICNLHCPLCASGSDSMTRVRGKLEWSVYRRFIDEIAADSLYVIFYHQGEPYVHKQFTEMVAYAKKKKLYVTTSTNGHFLDAQTAESTVKSGLDAIIISVDGATQATYSQYRVGGKLEQVLSGIRNLAAAKKRLHSKTPYIFMQFLVMQHNEAELPAMEKLARDLGVDRLLKKTTQVQSVSEASQWLPQNERFRRYHINADGIRVKTGGQGACPRPWLTTLLDWDGRIAPCCFDKNADHSPGSLNDQEKFRTIWQSDAYKKFRRTLLRNRPAIDICRNCNQGIRVFR